MPAFGNVITLPKAGNFYNGGLWWNSSTRLRVRLKRWNDRGEFELDQTRSKINIAENPFALVHETHNSWIDLSLVWSTIELQSEGLSVMYVVPNLVKEHVNSTWNRQKLDAVLTYCRMPSCSTLEVKSWNHARDTTYKTQSYRITLSTIALHYKQTTYRIVTKRQ